jgi:hypothetical protein
VAEEALPLVPSIPEVLVLWPLVAAGDAARVPLSSVHVGTSPIEGRLGVTAVLGAVSRVALSVLAIRLHRSSVESMVSK